ncbi:MAG: site-specific integrase [Syntrophorhabdaceae bacterium]
MGYHTGMRKEEILSLTWNQVNIFDKKITLNAGETKNDEARIIPLVGELCDAIVHQKKKRDSEYPECEFVFFFKGRRIKDFRESWDNAFKKTGIEKKLFHDLRRTAVRNMVNAAIPEKIAMKISGHKTRSVFDRYNIVNEENLRDACAKLAMRYEEQQQTIADAENGLNSGILSISAYRNDD